MLVIIGKWWTSNIKSKSIIWFPAYWTRWTWIWKGRYYSSDRKCLSRLVERRIKRKDGYFPCKLRGKFKDPQKKKKSALFCTKRKKLLIHLHLIWWKKLLLKMKWWTKLAILITCWSYLQVMILVLEIHFRTMKNFKACIMLPCPLDLNW